MAHLGGPDKPKSHVKGPKSCQKMAKNAKKLIEIFFDPLTIPEPPGVKLAQNSPK